MKKRCFPVLAALLFSGILGTSCNAGKLNSKAEETATAFYTSLQKKDYNSALSLCSNKAFTTATKEAWRKVFEKNAGLLGDLQSFTKTSGFNIDASTSTGTTVKVAFDVQWQYGKSKDSVLLIKEKDGSMKIYRYTWQHIDTKYLSELDESEKLATRYMDAIKTGDYNAAVDLCSDNALAITPRNKWIAFLENASSKLGKVTGYNVITDSSAYNIAAKGQSGKGNYYDIYIESHRGADKVMEKIVLFQRNYTEPVKLAGHFFL